MMGSNDRDAYDSEKPVHRVTVSSFLIGKYEVTQVLWESVMGNNPSNFKGPNRPVESVSWYEMVEFCNKLSEKEGLQKAYSGSGENIRCDFTSNGYRLPTEAEWEYAARGGNKSRGYKYSGSNDLDAVGWYDNNSGSATKEVGTKQPNELGIYDMIGNVWEWCWDWKGEYSSMPQENPSGPTFGSDRINRGGSWRDEATDCLATSRQSHNPEFADNSGGLRVVRKK
ncbi:MAG: formylglycine-generating enzyme family protein [Chlorobiota bacterium]|nr:MAG: formylglycine-generating enzyme family protein [Chlorobiota bacterium]